MSGFAVGDTVVRRDVYRPGKVWSEHALRVLADTPEALVTGCAPGAEVRWPALYVQSRAEDDQDVRARALDALATGDWELAADHWQDTEILLWKPPEAWFSVNAFFVTDTTGRRLRNWYVNFERPTTRTPAGFDTFDLALDLLVTPDLDSTRWKDEDEYAQLRRLGVITAAEHEAVDAAREQVLAMIAERSGAFAEGADWAEWRWEADWPDPRLPTRD
ncbi:DUF402 domain-containing protein [Streptomyces sp. NPDC056144]|uniref:DUF402 domain-containing protein n=1 Tax=unclassified Streptomyces TaxID=2593676 RepID=UPI0035E04322